MKIIVFGSIDKKEKSFCLGKNLCFAMRVEFNSNAEVNPEEVGKKFIEKEFEKIGVKDEHISFTVSYTDKTKVIAAKAEHKGLVYYAAGISNSSEEASAARKKSLFNKVGRGVGFAELEIEVNHIKIENMDVEK